MGVSEQISEMFINSVNGMTPDLDKLYIGSKDYDLGDWRVQQNSMVTVSGGASVVIPGVHVAGLVADAAFVLNRMRVATYGVGAILGSRAGLDNILEPEDFAAVLGYWADDKSIQEAMKGKGAAELSSKVLIKSGAKILGKGYVKGLTKVMLTSSGYLIGQKVGGKAIAKSAAKFAGKFGGKLIGGFVPFVGPIVGGGINLWLLNGIINAAEQFYRDKVKLIEKM